MVSLRVIQLEDRAEAITFRFEVSDSGIGIPKEALGKMFQSFSQADTSVTRRFGGTGLGLSICKKLVHLMGGEIGLTSEVGKGSTFWFNLTLRKGPDLIQFKEVEIVKFIPKPKSGKMIRILIAEDNPVSQKVAIMQLKKLGYYADAVGNGSEAIDALRSAPYDLVLMDCQMPVMDGYQASTLIRKSEPMKFRNIPIIAMTANAIKGDKEKCLEARMSDYVSKPVKVEALKAAIEKWLDFEVRKKSAS